MPLVMEFATAGPAAAATGALDRDGSTEGAAGEAAAARGCARRLALVIGASGSGPAGASDAPGALDGSGNFSAVSVPSGPLSACGVNANELRRTAADRMSGSEMACGVRGTAVGATTNAVTVIAAIPALNMGLAVRSISLLCLVRSDPDVSVRGAHA
ncbi:Uncharacterised protein [Mycobacteroides abscessus subsp. massiliense]|nr:Uncharacterised protein [Mycobacteroides abscessus subsp. massiliense]